MYDSSGRWVYGGLCHGAALSSFLFAVVMDGLTDEVRQDPLWMMMFADDTVIFSEIREQVEVCAGERRNIKLKA